MLGGQGCSDNSASDSDAGLRFDDASRSDSSLGDAPQQSCQPLVGGDDDFGDGILASMWIPFGRSKITETNGAVTFALQADETPPQSAALFAGQNELSLVGRRFFAEVLDVGNQEELVAAQIRFGNDNTDYKIEVIDGKLRFYHRSYGQVVVDETVVEYDPVAHRYWQMREEDGFVYAEVGASANQWTLLGQSKVDIESETNALTDSYIGIGAQARGAVSNAGLVQFDNFNTGSGCPQ